jgi:hypothetical protein
LDAGFVKWMREVATIPAFIVMIHHRAVDTLIGDGVRTRVDDDDDRSRRRAPGAWVDRWPTMKRWPEGIRGHRPTVRIAVGARCLAPIERMSRLERYEAKHSRRLQDLFVRC